MHRDRPVSAQFVAQVIQHRLGVFRIAIVEDSQGGIAGDYSHDHENDQGDQQDRWYEQPYSFKGVLAHLSLSPALACLWALP